MTTPLTMAQAAALLGMHPDTFRKGWRAWPGFPRPYLDHPRRWSAEAVTAWIADRSAPETAPAPVANLDRRAAAQRAELARLRAA